MIISYFLFDIILSFYTQVTWSRVSLIASHSHSGRAIRELSVSTTHQSRVIYQSAMAYHRLAVIAMEDDSILETGPMAIVANLALCVELLLKATDAKVTRSPIGQDGPMGQASIGSKVWGMTLLTSLARWRQSCKWASRNCLTKVLGRRFNRYWRNVRTTLLMPGITMSRSTIIALTYQAFGCLPMA